MLFFLKEKIFLQILQKISPCSQNVLQKCETRLSTLTRHRSSSHSPPYHYQLIQNSSGNPQIGYDSEPIAFFEQLEQLTTCICRPERFKIKKIELKNFSTFILILIFSQVEQCFYSENRKKLFRYFYCHFLNISLKSLNIFEKNNCK